MIQDYYIKLMITLTQPRFHTTTSLPVPLQFEKYNKTM